MKPSVQIVFSVGLAVLALATPSARGQVTRPRVLDARNVAVHSAWPWLPHTGTRNKAKAVAANDYVLLLETGTNYGPFDGMILLRISQLHAEGTQFLEDFRRYADRLPGSLPGDDFEMSACHREVAISLTQVSLSLRCSVPATGRFPQRAIYASDGSPLLSWRVKVLPYLGEEALFKQFRLDEPWNSDHNLKLINSMPLAFTAGEQGTSGKTRIQAPVSTGGLWEGRGGAEYRSISDDPKRTISVAWTSAENAVIWTKPDDVNVDTVDCRIGLISEGMSGISVGFCDGHYAQLPPDTSNTTLRGYLTIGGREQLPLAGPLLPRISTRYGP